MEQIENLNLVNRNAEKIEEHKIKEEKKHIILCFNKEQDVIIIGAEQDVFWVSRTKINEEEKNKAIFQYIADKTTYELVTSEYEVLHKTNIIPEELNTWYKTRMYRRANSQTNWETPFGCYYAEDVENHGKYFANDICVFRQKLQKTCKYREAGGKYKNILEDILKTIRMPRQNYPSIKELAEIVERESYLLVSENQEVREIYIQIQEEIYSLYSEYMTAVR